MTSPLARPPVPESLKALFETRVQDYRATVTRCLEVELPATVAARLRSWRGRELVVPPDLPEAWVAGCATPGLAGLEISRDSPDRWLSVPELDKVGGALTGCALAIAETGTLILDGGKTQGRRVLSLLPDYHLCVVFAHQLVRTVPEAVRAMDRLFRDGPRPFTLVSGPSATSDIELVRVEGVHGPRTLDVILVTDP